MLCKAGSTDNAVSSALWRSVSTVKMQRPASQVALAEKNVSYYHDTGYCALLAVTGAKKGQPLLLSQMASTDKDETAEEAYTVFVPMRFSENSTYFIRLPEQLPFMVSKMIIKIIATTMTTLQDRLLGNSEQILCVCMCVCSIYVCNVRYIEMYIIYYIHRTYLAQYSCTD